MARALKRYQSSTYFGSLRLNFPRSETQSKEPENGFCFCFALFFSAALWNWVILFERESLPKMRGAELPAGGVVGVIGDSMAVLLRARI